MAPENPLTYAIDYVLHFEDEKLEGKVTADGGGKTRFGLAQRWNPQLTNENFYNVPKVVALRLARTTYATKYASKIQATKILDKRVRAKILDMYVNMGTPAIHIAQRACGAREDGGMDDLTLALLNSATPERILTRLATMSLTRYNTLEGSKEEHESWMKRARCLGEIGVNWTLGQGGPKTDEQVLISEQHGGRTGSGAETEGQRTPGSGVDEGQKS